MTRPRETDFRESEVSFEIDLVQDKPLFGGELANERRLATCLAPRKTSGFRLSEESHGNSSYCCSRAGAPTIPPHGDTRKSKRRPVNG